jgi:hypothetical protein
VLDNLIGKGLQREATDAEEIRRLRRKITTRLDDARNEQISLDSRFGLAYEALLQIGLVALRANGLRPDSRGGHHVIALQTLDTTVQYPREKLRLLDRFRRQRAAGLYDASFEPSEVEVETLINTVSELKDHLDEWLSKSNPEWK